MLFLHRLERPPEGYTGTNFDPPARVALWLKANPDAFVSFDGVYDSVLRHSALFLGRERRCILFPSGAHAGKDNGFDKGEPPGRYLSWEELAYLGSQGFEIGWHTWTHPDLTKLSDADLLREITPPWPMKSFAYPYGRYDARVKEAVHQAGYERAYSTGRGDGTRLALKRFHLPK